ncbi:MAG: hypothetical protein GQ564_12900 [Bacteroidales bacterium]|nr:hypothetical protein [Bacteroidales bacterium]
MKIENWIDWFRKNFKELTIKEYKNEKTLNIYITNKKLKNSIQISVEIMDKLFLKEMMLVKDDDSWNGFNIYFSPMRTDGIEIEQDSLVSNIPELNLKFTEKNVGIVESFLRMPLNFGWYEKVNYYNNSDISIEFEFNDPNYRDYIFHSLIYPFEELELPILKWLYKLNYSYLKILNNFGIKKILQRTERILPLLSVGCNSK